MKRQLKAEAMFGILGDLGGGGWEVLEWRGLRSTTTQSAVMGIPFIPSMGSNEKFTVPKIKSITRKVIELSAPSAVKIRNSMGQKRVRNAQ